MKQEHWKGRSNISIYQMDCLEAMKEMEDNAFDLAIVDPPYGMPKDSTHSRGKLKNRILNNGGVEGWDIAPKPEYFKELMRVSKNQIIWGGNYFNLPPTRGFVIWDKEQPFENFSAAEYAWMSFQVTSKIFRLAATRTGDGTKIHPTQKPVKLYEWLLMNYAKEGDKILDTHLGSGSHALACWNLNFDLTAYELDADYFTATTKRIEKHTRQIQLF
jgi:site-specific DNA-methyltransferase (adenine-specific)